MTCANSAPALRLDVWNVTVANGVTARGIALGIGNPEQLVSIYPSISDDATWVVNADNCISDTDYKCFGTYDSIYNRSKSRTYHPTDRADWNGTGIQSDTASVAAPRIYFNDEIRFGDFSGSVPGYPLLMAKQGYYENGGGLGVGVNSTFMDQAVKAGAAPTKDWGLWMGSRSVDSPVDGQLWVGGYDSARVTGPFTIFPFSQDCATCVQIQDLRYVYNGGNTSLFSTAGETLSVVLEPWTWGLEVPPDIYLNLARAINTTGALLGYQDYLTLSGTAQLGNLSVTLSNGYQTVIPAQEIFFMPRQIDDSGHDVISNNTYKISEVLNTTQTDNYLFNWGIPFFTMNYMIMEYDQEHFRMAPARQGAYTGSNGALVQKLCTGGPTATASATTSATNSLNSATSPAAVPVSAGKSKTPVGAIAGGVVGGVAGIIIIAALIWFLMRSKRRETTMRQERDAAIAGGSEAGTHERQSQYTATSPTEVSEIYSSKAHNHQNIDQWLQNRNDAEYHDGQTTTADTQPTHASATVNAPFEMPAYQYR